MNLEIRLTSTKVEFLPFTKPRDKAFITRSSTCEGNKSNLQYIETIVLTQSILQCIICSPTNPGRILPQWNSEVF